MDVRNLNQINKNIGEQRLQKHNGVELSQAGIKGFGNSGEQRLQKLLLDAAGNYNIETAKKAEAHWNQIQHPLHGLGLLEDALAQIAGLTDDENIMLEKKAVVIFCADNGVVQEQVTQTGSYVTGIVAKAMVKGNTPVGMMAQRAGADVIPVDMGIKNFSKTEGVLNCRIGNGTGNILRENAMSREDCVKAILTGIDLAGQLKTKGYRLLAAGEMGIGNTTTASACAAVLLNTDPANVTGKGAGLSDAGLVHKLEVIHEAIRRNGFSGYIAGNRYAKTSISEESTEQAQTQLTGQDSINTGKDVVRISQNSINSKQDTIDIISGLGGYDIAGMCGLFLGGIVHRIPVLIDGVVSSVAALAALRICPASRYAMLATHVSSEPAGVMILEAMGMKPLITAGMHLGEGTGALLAMPMLDMALAVYSGEYTFDKGGVEPYQPM